MSEILLASGCGCLVLCLSGYAPFCLVVVLRVLWVLIVMWVCVSDWFGWSLGFCGSY